MAAFQLQTHSITNSSIQAEVNSVLQAALDAADPRAAVRAALRREGSRVITGGQTLDLDDYQHVFVTGAGKAVASMAAGAQDVLGDRINGGVLIAKHRMAANSEPLPPALAVRTGEHPVPGESSLRATRELVNLLSACRSDDLVLCLISGGGSALLTLPQPDISLDDIQELTRLLLASGATIAEINSLRKHLDQVKGGGLARFAHPARLVTLVLSDVVGSPLSAIASGPTVADPTTYADALAVLDRYGIAERVPGAVRWALEEGHLGFRPETMKPGDPLLDSALTVLAGSNRQSAQAAVEAARRAGFQALLLTTYLQGEARQAGEVLGGILRQCAESGDPLPRPACLVAGGETTVTLRGDGLGGRNQELALGAVEMLAGVERAMLITLATDGEDGPTDAAGAVVTGETAARAAAENLNPRRFLAENNAYAFFHVLDDLIRPGPTGTNVNDLVFLFTW